jgi:hypothetical protein
MTRGRLDAKRLAVAEPNATIRQVALASPAGDWAAPGVLPDQRGARLTVEPADDGVLAERRAAT